MINENVLHVRDLKVHYLMRAGFLNFGPKQYLKAVDGVSLELKQGETLGLVGESGCGKSSLGRAIIRLNKPTSGHVEIGGIDFLALKGEELRKARTNIQMVFQDPYGSLDPRMTVFDILAEPLRAHKKLNASDLGKSIRRILSLVSLRETSLKKYPHEFSGGQRQRIAIARALVVEPKILIADEPVSSLDVSVQAEILNLLKDIKSALGLSMIFIAHNLSVVKYISDRIAVMYLGKIVEIADRKELYRSPMHPYTKALVSAVPIPDPKLERERRRLILQGELPSPLNPPVGCPFHTRCPLMQAHCKDSIPPLEEKAADHWVSCFEVAKIN